MQTLTILRRMSAATLAAVALTSVAAAAAATPASAQPTIRDSIVKIAERELADDSRNSAIQSGLITCNFYTGNMNGDGGECSTPGWANGQWCADFAKYVWR